ALDAYTAFPVMIEDAVACLDLDPQKPRDPAETARLAIDLEAVLNRLDLALNSIPDQTEPPAVVAYEGDGFKVGLRRLADGLWRFDRDTVERIPAMRRAALAGMKNLQAER